MSIPASIKSLNGGVDVTSGVTPTGTIIALMGTTVPAGYLFCDGTVYNIMDYPNLATYFETNFGSKNKFGGDGTTTFAVPDLKGEFLRGAGTNSHTGCGNGSGVGTHQNPTFISRYWLSKNGNLVFRTNKSLSGDMVPLNQDSNTAPYGSTFENRSASGTAGTTTEDYTHYSLRPTNTCVAYCIKY